jgi:hypothetical protein
MKFASLALVAAVIATSADAFQAHMKPRFAVQVRIAPFHSIHMTSIFNYLI